MSPDDLGFEETDDELGRALRLRAPESHDAESTLGALRPHMAGARRRRVAGLAAGWSAVAAGIVALAITVVPGAERSVRTRPANQPDVTTTTAPFTTSTTRGVQTVPDPGGVTPTTTEPGDDHGGGDGVTGDDGGHDGSGSSGPGGGGDGTSGGSANSGSGSGSGSGSDSASGGGGTEDVPH